jgi:hypothetical protein
MTGVHAEAGGVLADEEAGDRHRRRSKVSEWVALASVFTFDGRNHADAEIKELKIASGFVNSQTT